MADKICPILMAGTMIYEIHTETDHTTIHKVYSYPPYCRREKCEWFENGCPAHPKVELEYKLGTIKPLPQK